MIDREGKSRDRAGPAEALGPELPARLEGAWRELHARLGPNLMLNPAAYADLESVREVPAGWTRAPEELLGSIRSVHLRVMRLGLAASNIVLYTIQ